MVYSPRIGPDGAFVREFTEVRRRVQSLESKPTGNIVVRETLTTEDPETGVKTVFGELPDGSFGLEPFVGDTTPPPVATAPTVTAQPGTMTVIWDGLFVGNAEKPRDFQHVNVTGHKIIDNVTVRSVIVGVIRLSTEAVIVTSDVLSYGETWQFTFESEDYNGNLAVPSARSASVDVLSLVDDSLVGEALADLTEAAGAAQTAADVAQTAAGTAQTAADDAAQSALDATNLAAGKSKVHYNTVTPPLTGNTVGDMWVDIDDSYALYSWSGSAWVKTQDSQEAIDLASTKIRSFVQAGEPVGTTVGDIWMDTDNKNELFRWNGSAWISYRDLSILDADAKAAQAIADAATAKDIADGKVATYFQIDMPTGQVAGDIGDLWFDTNDNNKMWRWTGSAWVVADDQRIAAAVTAAANAKTIADSKITTLYQDAEPSATGRTTGDLWVDTNDGNKLYRWSGSVWQSARDLSIASASNSAAAALEAAQAAQTAAESAQAVADGAIRTFYQSAAPTGLNNTTNVGDLWFDTDDDQAYRWSGTAWVLIQDNAIATALAAAQNAQSTADGKITSFYQPGQPVTGEIGDLWFDTDDKNKPYYCSSVSPLTWTQVRDGAINDAQSTANTALTSANGKNKTYYQTGMPTGGTYILGDTWVDTDDANKMYVHNGTTFVSAQDGAIGSAASLAASKGKVLIQTAAPAVADQLPQNLWIDTTGGLNTPKRWNGSAWVAVTDKVATDAASAAATAQNKADQAFNNAASAATAAGTAQTTADGKNRVWYQIAAPTGTAHRAGDLWFDTDDGNKPYVWVTPGNTWTSARDASISTAQSKADTAFTTATAKNKTYFQPDQPSGGTYAIGDMWVDTDGGYKLTTWNGSIWQTTQDALAAKAEAISAAASDATTKATNAQTAAISAANTAADSKVATAKAAALVEAAATAQAKADAAEAAAIAAAANTAQLEAEGAGQAAIDAAALDATAKANAAQAAATTAAAADAESKAATAKADAIYAAAITAQQKADAAQAAAISAAAADATTKVATKNASYYETTQPTGGTYKKGDLWFDTDDNYKLHTYTGSAWQATQDAAGAKAQAIATAASDATTKATNAQNAAISAANTAADSKVATAKAAALTEAAATAQTKADAAEQAAIDAAAITAQLKADGAEQSAIDAAAATAQAKADAAQAAAISAANTAADSKVATAKAAALTEAAATAQTKADQAKADAIAAAAADATTKANNAKTAAISAAATDASTKASDAQDAAVAAANTAADSKVATAKAAALTEAATTAQQKADAAEAAAISAAATTAQLKADGAEQAAIDAAAIVAQDKANIAKSEAITAANTAADSKVAVAKAATLTEAAATAQTKADAAQSAALISAAKMNAFSKNASFEEWTSTLPNGYGSFTTGPTKETSIVLTGNTAARWNLADTTTSAGLSVGGSILGHLPNLEYYTVEMEFYLVSGGLGGSGMILDWSGLTNNRTQINLASEFPTVSTGKWYRLTKVLRRPTNATGTWTSMSGYLMANWSGHGAGAVKNLIFDWFNVRPSTTEEITSYGQVAAISAAQTAAFNDATAKADLAKAQAITAAESAAQIKIDQVWQSARSYINPLTSTNGIVRINGADPTITTSSSAMGGKALLKQGTAHGWWADRNAKQAFDPTALYRLTVRARVVTAATTGGATIYTGVQGYAADGTTLVNSIGLNDTSNQHYLISETFTPTDGTWKDFVGYFKGNSPGNADGSNTALNPRRLNTAVRHIEPMVILDYNGGNGVWEVSHWSIDVIDASGHQALVNANTAKTEAIAAAALDATQKADQAKADAIATAATDATTKVATKSATYYQTAKPTGGTYKKGDVWFDTDDGNKIYVHNGTDFIASQDAAIFAVQPAVTTAINTSANGKNKVVYSTLDASGTGYIAGDTWFKRDGAGTIVAQWEFTTSWQSRTLNESVIGNLSAGKITAGTLDADRIGANTITATKLVLGSGNNLAYLGSAESATSKIGYEGFTRDTVDKPAGFSASWKSTAGQGTTNFLNFPSVPVKPNTKYRVNVWVKADKAGSVTYLEPMTGSAAVGERTTPTYVVASVPVPTVWTRWSTVFETGTSPYKSLYFRWFLNHSNGTALDSVFSFTGFELIEMNTGELIVDGAIKAGSAIIENGAIGNAQIADLNADKITAGTIAAARLDAESIKSKIIEADYLQATDIFAPNSITSASGVFGVMDASVINAGTVGADRIDANIVRAKLISAPDINAVDIIATGSITSASGVFGVVDASVINAGTVAADRIDANVIRAKVIAATDINAVDIIAQGSITSASGVFGDISATSITSGTIAAGRLDAETVKAKLIDASLINAADIIASGSITATNGIIGSLDAAKISTGTLDAARIGAKSIRADKLFITSTDNLIQEPDFGNYGSSWGTAAYWSIDSTGGRKANSPAGKITHSYGSNQGNYNQPINVPTDGGRAYRMAMWVKADVIIPIGGIFFEAKVGSAAGTTSYVDVRNSAIIPANTWTQVSGIVKMPADAHTVSFQPTVRAGTPTGSIWLDSMEVTRAADGALIVDGAVTAEKVFANAITASKLESELVLASKIIAGSPTGTHAEMAPGGFRVYAEDPLDGIPNEVVRLGVAASNDYLAVTDSNGTLVTTISHEGVISAKSVNIGSEIWYKGSELTGLLDQSARGLQAYGIIQQDIGFTTSEYGMFDVSFEADATRAYRVSVRSTAYTSNGEGVKWRIRSATGTTRPGIGSYLQREFEGIGSASQWLSDSWDFVSYPSFQSSGTWTERYLLTAQKVGTGTGTFKQGEVTIEDIGPRIWASAGINNGGGSAAAAPIQYVKHYQSNNSRSYNGSNTDYPFATDKMFQGLSPAGYGNMKSIALFPNMTTDLSGATISRMELFMYFDHWYNNAGGTAFIGVHGHTGIPGTFSHADVIITSAGWPKPGGRWIDIPSNHWANFQSGVYRGVSLLGDGTYNSYGYAQRPEIKITYSK